MEGASGFSIASIVTPAVVATAITFFLNFRIEKKKAERDYITKLFENARDDVRKAVEAGVEYFPLAAAKREPIKEAKIWMGERDVRHSSTVLIQFCGETGTVKDDLIDALDDFIDSLTGGTFQNSKAVADLEQARKIAAAGAKLRTTLATARQVELRRAIDSDPLSRGWRRGMDYMNENMGVTPDMYREASDGN